VRALIKRIANLLDVTLTVTDHRGNVVDFHPEETPPDGASQPDEKPMEVDLDDAGPRPRNRFRNYLFSILLVLFFQKLEQAAGRAGRRDELVHTRLAARRCGACGYDLKELEPSPDGCTHCAECAAKWDFDAYQTYGRIEYSKAGSARTSFSTYSRKIHDARGWDFELRSALEDKAARALVRRTKRKLPLATQAIPFLILATLLLPPLSSVLPVGWTNPDAWRVAFAMLLVIVLPLYLVAAGSVSHRAVKRLMNDSIRADQCPACESPLGPLMTDYPRIRACTRCGGAWPPAPAMSRSKHAAGVS
jgi:ribosomal protein L37AE/L43A